MKCTFMEWEDVSLKIAIIVMLLLSLFFGVWNQSAGNIGTAILSESTHAVELVISLAGALCLWSGLMRVAQDSGLTQKIARLLQPLICFLFRGIKKGSEAVRLIAMNMTANLLGLGNASTPLGIAAMRELAKDAPPGTASNHMVMLTVLNTASIQLIPTTAAMLRLRHGAASPFDILPAVLIVSLASAAAALFAAWLAGKFHFGGRKRI